MTRHEFDIYVELYKRKEYSHIPIGAYPNGDYFYMTKKQVHALGLLNDNKTTHVGYGGSARSGKSVIECTAIIFDGQAYDDIAWGLARKELTTLKRTVLITLFNQLAFYGFKAVSRELRASDEFNYNQQLNKLIFYNKSEVFLIDTAYKPSDPLNTRFGGFELTRSAIDESNETQLSVVNKLFERTGWRNNDRHGIKRKQFECFNPDKNHVYSRYWIPFRDNKEDDYKKFIRALPTDNPNPAVKEWVDDIIRTGDTATVERQIHGNFDFDDDPSKLCEYDAICDIFTNDHVKEGTKYISADLAMQGRDKFIAGSWSGLICSVDIDKDKSSGKDIELSLKELKTNKSVGNSNIVADSDGLGAYLESYIKNIKTFHGGSAAVDNKTYWHIKDECGFKLAEIINKRLIKIICYPEQEEAIKQELSICLKRDNINLDKKRLISKDIMKEKLGHSPDYLDMLLMRMLFEIKKDSGIYDFEIRNKSIDITESKAYTYIVIDKFATIITAIHQDGLINVVECKDGIECDSEIITDELNSKYEHSLIIESTKNTASIVSQLRLKNRVFGIWKEPKVIDRMIGQKSNIRKYMNLMIDSEHIQPILTEFYQSDSESKDDINIPNAVSGLFAHLEKHYRLFQD